MSEVIPKRHIEILEHMLGDKSHYRNHFATFEEGKDFKALCEMERKGLVKKRTTNSTIFGDMIYFSATEKGKKEAFKNE